jgi:hypothetical protein
MVREMTAAIAERMEGLLLSVVDTSADWAEVTGREGSAEEFNAHEELVHAILDFADEYRGFQSIQRALDGLR